MRVIKWQDTESFDRQMLTVLQNAWVEFIKEPKYAPLSVEPLKEIFPDWLLEKYGVEFLFSGSHITVHNEKKYFVLLITHSTRVYND